MYRYTGEALLSDFLGRNKPIEILEFNTKTEKIRVSYKENEPKNFELINPNQTDEMDEERKIKIEVVVRTEDINEALYRAQEKKIAIMSFLSMYSIKLINDGAIKEELTETSKTVQVLCIPSKGKPLFNAEMIEDIGLLFKHPDDKISLSH